MSKKYDVIVIGAGNGGLTAATKMALNGKKTLLVERHNLPGGYATSFVRGRFEFEASLHELCGIGPITGKGALADTFKELGIYDRIEWIPVNEAFRTITINDEENYDYAMPTGKENFINKAEEYCPGARKYIELLLDLAVQINNGIDFISTLKSFSAGTVKTVFDEHINFLNIASYSVSQVFDALNIPQKIRDIFGGYWCYLGVDLDELNFIHYCTMFHSYIVDGAVIPKNRSHSISCALLDRFEELGGEVWFNSDVKKIIVKDKLAKGIVLDDGTEVFADYVIANASPYNVLTKMIDGAEIPKFQTQDNNAKQLAVKGFAVFLGLNKSYQELGLENHSYFIYDSADTKKVCELSRTNEKCALQATVCLNKAIPDCSPEGTTILYMTSVFQGDEAWKDITPENYVKEKRRYADIMIDDFERATGAKIKDAIEEIEIAAPSTYVHYNDAPNGTIYGFQAAGTNTIVHRLMTMAMGDKIKNLGFCGGYTQQCIGFSPSYQTGIMAADNATKYLDKEAASK